MSIALNTEATAPYDSYLSDEGVIAEVPNEVLIDDLIVLLSRVNDLSLIFFKRKLNLDSSRTALQFTIEFVNEKEELIKSKEPNLNLDAPKTSLLKVTSDLTQFENMLEQIDLLRKKINSIQLSLDTETDLRTIKDLYSEVEKLNAESLLLLGV